MHATHKAAPKAAPTPDAGNLWQRLRFYFTPIDGRYEDLAKGRWYMNVLRDFTAGLIVAMVAIPLAMASGLPPEMGIVGGAVAGLVGALFGGSKYQVYGPTAAFIPVIAAITAKYEGYSFLILCSLIAGVILLLMGVFRLGRLVARVPNSIVVGFTIGIACVIGMSQLEQVLGLKVSLGHSLFDKASGVARHIGELNVYAIIIAVITFVVTKYLLKISKFIPAPLIALGVCTLIASTVWSGMGLTVVRDKYGAIPENLLQFTLPGPIALTPTVIWDLCYFVIAIVFVSGVESLLCSRMADRLADNRGVPYNPNKELWGQGWVQILVPLLNGFPHTGALARTATNIKVGAVSPLAGIFKFALKLLLAVYLAQWLEMVPMACIGGILMFVAVNMVKPAEVREVWNHNRFHAGLMVYTAVMVPMTDFLIGVLSALGLYAVLFKFLDTPPLSEPRLVEQPADDREQPRHAGPGTHEPLHKQRQAS
jgi:MFS superfamily sulfate permease-like transporter